MKTEISFDAPKGFAPPEDSEPGKPFEVMATVRMGDDGKLVLEALDGATLDANEEGDPDGDAAEDKAGEMSGDMAEGAPEEGFLGAIEKGMA